MTRGDYYTSVDQALGSERVDALARTNSEIDKLNAVVSHAVTLDSIMFPISHGKSEQLRTMIKPTERWGDLTQANGDHLCIDKISHVGLQNIFDAAVFPELHMRLISWWICHAWRLLDLARTAIQSLEDWNLAVAALCSRGLIEQVGCLLSESKEISRLWAEAKDLDGKMLEGTDRVDVVRSRLHEPLGKYAFAARGLGEPEKFKATNVQTYVGKLAKVSDIDIRKMYDWLSNAAHPAVGSRAMYANQSIRHPTGAFLLCRYSLRPTSMEGRDDCLRFSIAESAADSTVNAACIGLSLLWSSLSIVDDFGLTTAAATLTDHVYWRNFKPALRNAECPCGCGKYKKSLHKWRAAAPPLRTAASEDATVLVDG